MKPFLTEILACPIDKSYPLDVFIFKWEDVTPEILSFFEAPSIETSNGAFEKPLITKVEDEDGHILLSDLIVLGKKPVAEYLQLILVKIKELEVFRDTTNSKQATILKQILGSIREKITQVLSTLEKGTPPSEVLPSLELDLTILNAYKQRIEVEEGLLWCPQCKRWYPIVETIPQMLPDNLRHQKQDLAFLAKWQTQVPDAISREGQPFHI